MMYYNHPGEIYTLSFNPPESSTVPGFPQPVADSVVVLREEGGHRVQVIVRNIPSVVWVATEQKRGTTGTTDGLCGNMVFEECAFISHACAQCGHIRQSVVLPIVVEIVRHNWCSD